MVVVESHPELTLQELTGHMRSVLDTGLRFVVVVAEHRPQHIISLITLFAQNFA